MAEPFFASMPQLWASPPGSIGYAPPLAGARPLASVPPHVMQGLTPSAIVPGATMPATVRPDAYGGIAPAVSGPVFGAGLSAAMAGPTAGVPYSGSEIAVGVTAPALLATVAMRRGQPLGPANDQEIEEFISDALDLLPGTTEVEVRSESGRTTLAGTVPHKRLKHDAGEIAWAIPGVNDVHNNITITARRRSRGPGRENEPAAAAGRKQT